ncbi:MATE family efflux transporter [Acetobacterium tundrae]|nr:MATE family efflux transporter [Acetobacterium tundrae]
MKADKSGETQFKRTGILLRRKFFAYLLPTIMMNAALSLGIVVDGIIVGNILGTEAFAAVNICAPMMFLFSALYALIGVGGSIRVAHCKGRMDHNGANLNFTLSLLGLVIVSVLFATVGFIFADQIATVLSGGSSLKPLVKDFLSVLVLGAPVLITVPGMVYFIRTDSHPRLAANILIIANVINLILDLVFMGVFKMGIAGAALATVSGYLVGAAVSGIYFGSPQRHLKFVRPALTDLKNYSELFLTGAPPSLTGITYFLRNLSINTILVGTIGPMGVATFGVCMNMLSLSTIVIGGTAQTIIPVVGCTYGEKDYQGITAIIKTAITTVTLLCVSLLVVFVLFPLQIAGLFGITGDSQTMASIQAAIRIFSLSLPFFGINFLMICYYQTVDRRGFSAVITVLENILIILSMILLMERQFGERGIWIAFVLSEMLTLSLIVVMTWLIKKQSTRVLQPILLLEKIDTRIMDVTISNSIAAATGISQKMMDFCVANQIDARRTNRVGVIVEELSVNIITHGFKKNGENFIDIRLSIVDTDLVLRLRDDGEPFNPIAYLSEFGTEKSLGLKLVNEMATDFNYSYILNFNNILISMADVNETS